MRMLNFYDLIRNDVASLIKTLQNVEESIQYCNMLQNLGLVWKE